MTIGCHVVCILVCRGIWGFTNIDCRHPPYPWIWKEMLAGYNTANHYERKKYNEKRLLRVAGVTLLSVGILIVFVFYQLDQGSIGIVALLVVPLLPLLVGVPLMNSKYVKNNE